MSWLIGALLTLRGYRYHNLEHYVDPRILHQIAGLWYPADHYYVGQNLALIHSFNLN